MPKDFVTISRQECLSVYKELINSQERHFKSAETLASIEEYGQAVSHLILGSEELVKALIIYFDGLGLRIRSIKGVKKFFRDHRTRHFTAGIFLFLSRTIKPMMQFIERFKVLIYEPAMRTNMTEFETAIMTKDKAKAEEMTKEWAEDFGKKMLVQMDFWEQADDLKQQGFYVDYQEKLMTSKILVRTDYDNAYFSTSSFCNDCKSLITYFENATPQDKNSFVQAINKDKKMYDILESFLSVSVLPHPNKSNKKGQ